MHLGSLPWVICQYVYWQLLFLQYVCHNSLFTCLFYYILAFIHTSSLLSFHFLIVLATNNPCRSGTLFSCISDVACMPLHPSSYWLFCMLPTTLLSSAALQQPFPSSAQEVLCHLFSYPTFLLHQWPRTTNVDWCLHFIKICVVLSFPPSVPPL